jgi:hypothetical protein
MMTNAETKRREAALNYIASEKSDPFAYGRVMLHMRNGVAGFITGGQDAFYSADREYETAETPLGEKFPREVFRNKIRP